MVHASDALTWPGCSKRKPRQVCPPGLAFATSISRSGSWIEVVLDAEDAGPDVGVCDRHCGNSVTTSRVSSCADERSARERRFGHLRVEDVYADIEVLHRVPQRAGANCPSCPIGAARSRNRRVSEEVAAGDRRDGAAGLVVERRTDQSIDRLTVGVIFRVTTVERGANIRRPVVLNGGPHVPIRRQLQVGSAGGAVGAVGGTIVRIIHPAEPDPLDIDQVPRVVGEPDSSAVIATVTLADAVLALNGERVTLGPWQVELKPALDRPSPLVVGMVTIFKHTKPRIVVIQRPVIMRDGSDLCAAPGLIDPDRPDNVRNQGAGSIDIVGSARSE
jgi:hypothetical protein